MVAALLPRQNDRLTSKPDLFWAQVAIHENQADAVAGLLEVYDFAKHPYFRWLANPATTREAFRASQVPFRFAVESFSQALAGVLARIPRVEDRAAIADNIAEEHGRGNLSVSHKYTFLEYLEALGATPKELDQPCPIWVTAFNHSIRNLCLAQPYECGAAALGIIEQLYVGVSATIARSIKERGWVEEGSQRHYAAHEVLDVEHAQELLDVAAPAWDTPRCRSSVALGLLLGAYYFWKLYEDLLPDA